VAHCYACGGVLHKVVVGVVLYCTAVFAIKEKVHETVCARNLLNSKAYAEAFALFEMAGQCLAQSR
jgi:hypothetical protein